MDDWLAALKAAACSFMPAKATLEHPFWRTLEGQADMGIALEAQEKSSLRQP
jgi:hypothetical protein